MIDKALKAGMPSTPASAIFLIDRPTPPSAQSLLQSAMDLAPRLKEMGKVHDQNKCVSSEIAAELRERGFFKICQSAENGGYGMRPSVLWKVAREVTRADTATGWILSLAGLHPWLAGMFPPAAQDEVFAGGKDAVVLALTGNVGRGVDARRVEGGFELTGKWTYASGIDMADWAATLVEVKTDDQRELLLMLVPKAHFTIDHDSWNTMGMRGTGSKDVYLERAFVPTHRTIDWVQVSAGKAPGKERNKDPMYQIPHTSLLVMSVAAAVVGAATCMLDLYREAIKSRIPAGLQQTQTEDRFSLAELGKAASRIEMAFDRLLSNVDEMYDQAARNEPFTIEQRTKYRTDGATICDVALDAGDKLARSLGGSLLPNGAIERCFRDMHAMASHFLMQINPSAELFGRALLNLPLPPGARI